MSMPRIMCLELRDLVIHAAENREKLYKLEDDLQPFLRDKHREWVERFDSILDVVLPFLPNAKSAGTDASEKTL